jgi:hypothetical protein
MKWEFESLKEMKEFAKILGIELERCGLEELSREVLEFKTNYYTTSSEYLGEIRIVLKKVLLDAKDELSSEWIESIEKGVQVINKVFSN